MLISNSKLSLYPVLCFKKKNYHRNWQLENCTVSIFEQNLYDSLKMV